MSDDKQKPGRSGLLGDLESIRSLLEEADSGTDADATAPDQAPAASDPSVGDDDVPLLEDVVQGGGVGLSDTLVSGQGDFQESGGSSGLNEEIFKALLSDEWRESARALLDQARDAIEQHQTEWTPEHTDELNAALKVRIDETVQQWLREVVQSRVDDLRRALLDGLSQQIRITVDEQFNRTSAEEDPDGE